MQTKKHESIDAMYSPDDLESLATHHEWKEIQHYFSNEEITKMKASFFELNNYQSTRTGIIDKIKGALTKEWDSEDPTGEKEEITIEDFVHTISFANIGLIGLKALKSRIKALLEKINQGFELRKYKLYAVSYNEIGLMAFYNEEGFFVYQRPCTPSEMQSDINTTIHKLAKAN